MAAKKNLNKPTVKNKETGIIKTRSVKAPSSGPVKKPSSKGLSKVDKQDYAGGRSYRVDKHNNKMITTGPKTKQFVAGEIAAPGKSIRSIKKDIRSGVIDSPMVGKKTKKGTALAANKAARADKKGK